MKLLKSEDLLKFEMGFDRGIYFQNVISVTIKKALILKGLAGDLELFEPIKMRDEMKKMESSTISRTTADSNSILGQSCRQGFGFNSDSGHFLYLRQIIDSSEKIIVGN